MSSQLNSNDAFILVTSGGSTLWVGVGASDTEKRGAQQLCDILGVSASELSEGGETGEEREERQPKPIVNCGQAAHIWLKRLVDFHNQDVGPSIHGCLKEGAVIASAFQMSAVISRFKTPPYPKKRILCPQFKQESSG